MPNSKFSSRVQNEARLRLRRVRHLPALGLLVLVTLAAGHAEPGDARRRAPAAEHDGPTHADSIRVVESPPKPYTFEAGRSWRRKAERMEARGESRELLKYLVTVMARESGSQQAEVRLWRGAYIYRQGLQLRAGAVFDSLLVESPRYSILLAVPIAENAWRAALATDRPVAAARAIDAWWAAHRQLKVLGLMPAMANAEFVSARLDSVYARACLDTGRLFLKWNRDREQGKRWLQRAVSVRLEPIDDMATRLDLAIMAGQDGATSAAAEEIDRLNADADRMRLPAGLRVRLRQARADAEYRAGRFGNAHVHYAELLPLARSAADSQWVLIQAADAARLAEDGPRARVLYDRYLRAFPGGTWSAWGRAVQNDVDSTLAAGEEW